MTVDDWARPLADLVVRRTLDRPATLGRGRLVCVDGPAGSGKTTLAGAVADAARRTGTVAVVHMDDIYPGWAGLEDALVSVAGDVVAPLREGRPGRYRRYDWLAGRPAETHHVDPVDVLVLEGVGAGAAAYADAVTTLVWVEVPPDLRLARGLSRDGAAVRERWLAWMADEDRVLARERTRDRADLIVDGTGATPPVAAQSAGRSST